MVSCLVGCEGQQAKEIRLAKEKLEMKKAELKMEREEKEELYRVPAILLALKYKVEEDKVFNLLVKEDLFYCFLGEKFTKNLRERIKDYSAQYGIPANIIASIYYDYFALFNDNLE